MRESESERERQTEREREGGREREFVYYHRNLSIQRRIHEIVERVCVCVYVCVCVREREGGRELHTIMCMYCM